MTTLDVGRLIVAVRRAKTDGEAMQIVRRRDAEIAAEATRRPDALYDSAFIAGANAGFRLGLENDNAGLAALITARDGYLARIRARQEP